MAREGGIGFHPRDRDQIAALFAGLDLVEPGIVPLLTWHPGPRDVGRRANPRSVYYYVGTARRP